MRTPRVCVLLPARNAAAYVGEAISSVLASSFTDFELVVVDDASTDDTARIVSQFNDQRLRLISRKEPSGDLAVALNEGLAATSCEFVARMDADDVCHPARLQRQVDFLDARRDVGLVGTWATVIDAAGAVRFGLRPPTDDVGIRFMMRYRCPLVHPSVMARREVLESVGGYRVGAVVEDYDLWVRLRPVTHFANIGEFLLSYRTHEAGVTNVDGVARTRGVETISVSLIAAVLGQPPELAPLEALREGRPAGGDVGREAASLVVALAAADARGVASSDARRGVRRIAAAELLTLAHDASGAERVRADARALRLSPRSALGLLARRTRERTRRRPAD